MVSSGLDLKAGDEVIVFHDNHPSNLTAWNEKAKRFGFTVIEIPQENPHPGMEYYIDAYKKAITAEDQGPDVHAPLELGRRSLPRQGAVRAGARERRDVARRRRAVVRPARRQRRGASAPDFYTGSAHKWPCGARECGVLYINARAQKNIWPSIYSAYPGAVGISRTFESFGQRDEATMIAFREALEFQTKVGREAIEKRSRALANQLIAGLSKLPDVKVWTSPNPRSTPRWCRSCRAR